MNLKTKLKNYLAERDKNPERPGIVAGAVTFVLSLLIIGPIAFFNSFGVDDLPKMSIFSGAFGSNYFTYLLMLYFRLSLWFLMIGAVISAFLVPKHLQRLRQSLYFIQSTLVSFAAFEVLAVLYILLVTVFYVVLAFIR